VIHIRDKWHRIKAADYSMNAILRGSITHSQQKKAGGASVLRQAE
jgi:hypothetical protein